MEIHLEKCKLRYWQYSDIDSLVESANNLNVARFLRDVFPSPYTVKDAELFISQVSCPNNNQLIFAITHDKKAIGSIGAHFQNDVYRGSVEIGYWLGEPYWGQGIATEIVTWISQYLFSHFEVRRIFAAVFEKNIASVKVLEKSGFQREAIHRKAVIKNGEVMDEHIFVRLS